MRSEVLCEVAWLKPSFSADFAVVALRIIQRAARARRVGQGDQMSKHVIEAAVASGGSP